MVKTEVKENIIFGFLESVSLKPPEVLMSVKVSQSCLTLCDPVDSTVHGILQVRTLERVAFSSSRGSSQARDRTQVFRIAVRFFSQLSHKGSPRIMEWVAYPFSSGSS